MFEARVRSRPPALKVGSTNAAPALAGSVVVFDDDPLVCKYLGLALARLGMSPTCAREIGGFRSAVASHAPSVILLDLALGETDAIEIFAFLKEEQYLGPVVLMSGDYRAALDHSQRIGVRLGVDIAGILRKPFSVGELSASLSSALSANRQLCPRTHSQARVSLMNAIDNGQVEFWFQPKVNLLTGRRGGVEILARVRHPERGLMYPAAFVPGAPTEGLRWLAMEGLRESLEAARKATPDGGSFAVAINVAPSLLESVGILEELKKIRDEVYSGAQVTLELTETDLGESVAADLFCTRAVLHGFKISIDDFGHGYSTFERLRSTPFAELKIEQSLVNGCARDLTLQKLCRAAVRLAHDFGAVAVAEGVEREDDLAMVRALGFDLVQGYYFAKPAPLSHLSAAREA